MKLTSFYRVPSNEWFLQDNSDVIASKRRAEADISATEETIEEYVRQWIIRELIETYGYPKEWIGERLVIEETIRMGSTEKQVDVSIKNSGHKTYLFIETKHSGCSRVEFDDARNQLHSPPLFSS